MEECYTCECGNQRWIIFGDRIKCDLCNKDFTPRGFWNLEIPENFNLMRLERVTEWKKE